MDKKEGAATKMMGSKGIWVVALLAVVLGFGTWFVLRTLGPSLPADFPGRPDLKSANAALVNLIDTTEAAARSHPESASDVGRLGMVYHGNQFYDQAQAAYAIASRLYPGDYRWAYYQTLLAEERGQGTAQFSLLEKVLQLKPDFQPALLRQGDFFLKQGEFEKAGQYYDKASRVAGGENSPQARFGAARIAQRRGDWVRVIENLEPLARDYPRVRPAHQLLAEAYAKRGGFQATDDAQLVERLGRKVTVVPGSTINLKIATREDLRLAEQALKALPKPKLQGPLHPFADDDMWR